MLKTVLYIFNIIRATGAVHVEFHSVHDVLIVFHALPAVMSNPSSLLKYQSDPKVGPILMKLMTKFSGAGGAPM